MKKIIISMLILTAWAASLTAGNITREQADEIVLDYLQNGLKELPCLLFVNVKAPSEEGIVITTFQEETFKAKYACWTYCVTPKVTYYPHIRFSSPPLLCYLFVKEDNGSLLEVITYNNYITGDFMDSWKAVDIPTGLSDEKDNSVKLLYPNPVSDWLTLPCAGENVRVEIYDLKGARLFSGLVSDEDCRLNVSFLNTGVYMVGVDGERYKIIKK